MINSICESFKTRDWNALRSAGLGLPQGSESNAKGAAPGCYLLASKARSAANAVGRKEKVRRL